LARRSSVAFLWSLDRFHFCPFMQSS
jgi:hypothetical protein